MNYVFVVPKKLDSWSKNVISGQFSVHFRWNFRRKNFVWRIFIAPKDSSLNFRGSLLSFFWANVLISAVISIIEDFGSLLPARTVTVKHSFRARQATEMRYLRGTESHKKRIYLGGCWRDPFVIVRLSFSS